MKESMTKAEEMEMINQFNRGKYWFGWETYKIPKEEKDEEQVQK